MHLTHDPRGVLQGLTSLKLATERARELEQEQTVESQEPNDEADQLPSPPEHWEQWLRLIYPVYTRYPFATHQAGFWRYVWSIQDRTYQRPFLAAWPRGGAKSTSVELGVSVMTARRVRHYGLYICANEERAIDHVGNVADMLGSPEFERYYPDAAARLLGKYGASLGWNRTRLRTRSGFTLDAVGLDVAARGVKIGADRPDLIILDDIDQLFDSTATVNKKMQTLTQSLLPAASADAVVIFAQNLIHKESIMSQLVDGRADFLSDRILSGPFPALSHPLYDTVDGKSVATAGEPIWEGQNLEICNQYISRFGLSSFRIECQQETDLLELSMFGHVVFKHCTMAEVPILDRIETWIDPAVSDTDTSDSNGIEIDGVRNGVLYRLWSWEQRASPEKTLRTAFLKSLEIGASAIGVETDQGGDVWRPAYHKVWDDLVADPDEPQITKLTVCPLFKTEKAAKLEDESQKGLGSGYSSKASRGQQMLPDYELGKIFHVVNAERTHETLEAALRRFMIRKPWDLTDCAFWAWRSLARPRGGVW